MITVASAFGRDPFEYLDTPFWKVLYAFYHLMEREERNTLFRRLERVDAGMMTHVAFNDASKLADEMRTVQDAIRALDTQPTNEVEALRAKANALAARIEAGKALTDKALVS